MLIKLRKNRQLALNVEANYSAIEQDYSDVCMIKHFNAEEVLEFELK